MLVTKVLLLIIIFLQVISIYSISYNYAQSSSKTTDQISPQQVLTIGDVLKNISFPKFLVNSTFMHNLTIAVIDSGINKSLIKNYWTNPGEIPNNSIDDDKNGYIDDYNGWDFVLNKSISFNGNFSSHGTFISNILGSMISNISAIKIMDIRVLDSGNKNSNLDVFANAVAYALSFPSVKVIEFSIEFLNSFLSYYPPLLQWIFTKAFLKHVAIVTVSGNDDYSHISDPGNWAETIAVSSIENYRGNWIKASYANSGSNIDVSTPGSNIQSIGLDGKPLVLSGTSFSAPFVAGAVAILDSLHYTENMSIPTIKALLQSSADKLHNCTQFGAGLLNVTNFMKLANYKNYSDYSLVCQPTYTNPTSLGPLPNTKNLVFSNLFITSFLIYVVIRKIKIKKLKRV